MYIANEKEKCYAKDLSCSLKKLSMINRLFLYFIFLLGHCTVNPLCVVGDDRVESRLFAGATFLPSIRGYPHRNALE